MPVTKWEVERVATQMLENLVVGGDSMCGDGYALLMTHHCFLGGAMSHCMANRTAGGMLDASERLGCDIGFDKSVATVRGGVQYASHIAVADRSLAVLVWASFWMVSGW